MHFKKAFSKKQELTWRLCSGPIRMICNSKVTSLLTPHFSTPWVPSCEGWDHSIHCNWWDQKSVRALLSLSFGPTTETLPPPWSINDFFQLVAEMRSKRGASRSHWKYSGTHRTQFRITCSHTSFGQQQWSTGLTPNMCRTAAPAACPVLGNCIISC